MVSSPMIGDFRCAYCFTYQIMAAYAAKTATICSRELRFAATENQPTKKLHPFERPSFVSWNAESRRRLHSYRAMPVATTSTVL